MMALHILDRLYNQKPCVQRARLNTRTYSLRLSGLNLFLMPLYVYTQRDAFVFSAMNLITRIITQHAA